MEETNWFTNATERKLTEQNANGTFVLRLGIKSIYIIFLSVPAELRSEKDFSGSSRLLEKCFAP